MLLLNRVDHRLGFARVEQELLSPRRAQQDRAGFVDALELDGLIETAEDRLHAGQLPGPHQMPIRAAWHGARRVSALLWVFGTHTGS